MPYKLPLFAGTNVRFTGFVFLFQLFFFFFVQKKAFCCLDLVYVHGKDNQ